MVHVFVNRSSQEWVFVVQLVYSERLHGRKEPLCLSEWGRCEERRSRWWVTWATRHRLAADRPRLLHRPQSVTAQQPPLPAVVARRGPKPAGCCGVCRASCRIPCRRPFSTSPCPCPWTNWPRCFNCWIMFFFFPSFLRVRCSAVASFGRSLISFFVCLFVGFIESN
jgi:hypothetical protein